VPLGKWRPCWLSCHCFGPLAGPIRPRTHWQQRRPYQQQSWTYTAVGNSRLCCWFVAGFGNSRLSTKSTVLNSLPVCTGALDSELFYVSGSWLKRWIFDGVLFKPCIPKCYCTFYSMNQQFKWASSQARVSILIVSILDMCIAFTIQCVSKDWSPRIFSNNSNKSGPVSQFVVQWIDVLIISNCIAVLWNIWNWNRTRRVFPRQPEQV